MRQPQSQASKDRDSRGPWLKWTRMVRDLENFCLPRPQWQKIYCRLTDFHSYHTTPLVKTDRDACLAPSGHIPSID